jgi:hypothetical protein
MTPRLALAIIAVACSMAAQQSNPLYGRWKVTAVRGASPVTAMSGSAAGRLVGRFLILSPKKTQFAGQTCNPTYDNSQEGAPEFVQDYKIDLVTLKLPDPVTRFDAGCTDVFVLGPDNITFTWDGYFLDATKVHAKVRDK